MRTCKKCHTDKEPQEFYWRNGKSGARCKLCVRAERAAYLVRKKEDPEWVERMKVYENDRVIKRNARYPEKYKAANAIRYFNKPPGIHLHHWSYLPEHRTDVVPLSMMEHIKAHTYIVYDQERMQYRRSSNMTLLSTKQEHLEYLAEFDIKPVGHE